MGTGKLSFDEIWVSFSLEMLFVCSFCFSFIIVDVNMLVVSWDDTEFSDCCNGTKEVPIGVGDRCGVENHEEW